MPALSDLVVYDQEGWKILVVEVKGKLNTSRDWAAQWRRNMLAHGGMEHVGFVLLVTPDNLYMWKDAGAEPVAVPPTYVIDAKAVLKPYFDSARVDPASISGAAFELLVGAWLADLVHSDAMPEQMPEPLAESGLLEAIRHGRVEYEVAA